MTDQPDQLRWASREDDSETTHHTATSRWTADIRPVVRWEITIVERATGRLVDTQWHPDLDGAKRYVEWLLTGGRRP
jgi:hypothetical protein